MNDRGAVLSVLCFAGVREAPPGREVTGVNEQVALFRRQAVAGRAERPLARVTAVVPPSGPVAAVVALACAIALGAVAAFVRIPVKVTAVGVLMPAGGIVPVVAVADGRVESVHRGETTEVSAGDPMFDVAVDSPVVGGVTTVDNRLRSLQREAAGLGRLMQSRERLYDERIAGLGSERAALRSRQALIRVQRDAGGEALEAIEARLERYASLVRDGHVSRDAYDREREALFRERAAVAGIEQQLAGIAVEERSLAGRIASTERERDIASAELGLRLEQLGRDIDATQSGTRYSIRAPSDGVVESLLVHPGSVIRKGQVVARLSHGPGPLEAWLYVPTSGARNLVAGQKVELQLDAWPRSVLGTRTATVYAVSTVPLLPGEIDVPLELGVPVYEVRARLDRQAVAASPGQWQLPPGTSFHAGIVERRMRLYEWLLRRDRA